MFRSTAKFYVSFLSFLIYLLTLTTVNLVAMNDPHILDLHFVVEFYIWQNICAQNSVRTLHLRFDTIIANIDF